MPDDHIKKIDDINNRVIRLEERLPIQIQHLSGTIDDFRSEMGEAVRDLSKAVRDQTGFNEMFRGHVSQQAGINERLTKVEQWKESANKYMFGAFVVGTILMWLLNQFVGPVISYLFNGE